MPARQAAARGWWTFSRTGTSRAGTRPKVHHLSTAARNAAGPRRPSAVSGQNRPVTSWQRLRRRVSTAGHDAAWRAVHWGWREFQRAGLITADTPAGRAFKAFGQGSIISFPPGSVFGEAGIEIGTGTLVGQQVTISAGTLPGQDLWGLTLLRIGDRCVIGRGTHIVAHQSVEIGDDVWTGPYVYIPEHSQT